LYEDYAIEALDLKRSKIDRKIGRLTLAGIGKASRLSSLVQLNRAKQQARLLDVLFLGARDGSTLPLAQRLIVAHGDGINDPKPFFEKLLAGRWGALASGVSAKVAVALAFGRLARLLLARFDRAYGYVDQHGWVADSNAVADASFPPDEMDALRSACAAVLQSTESGRFRQLQFHGPELLTLLTKLSHAASRDCFDHLLQFHRSVQRSRRGGGAWLREEQGKVVMQVAGYNGYKSDAAFPSFKLNVVRKLLEDLGRLN
jgi:hypothetical protein